MIARPLERRLRLPRHRATTAHLCSAYPFLAEAGLGGRGVYLGTNVLTGGGGFAYDPFEAYAAGTITNPNMLLAGEPGVGKSATAKVFIYRSVGVFGRWVAIADPKGEYLPLAEALGLDVIKLHPGGTARINPLDPGPAGLDDGPDELARRQATMVGALLGSVLHRDLSPVEDAVLGWAITHLARSGRRDITLADVAAVMANPTDQMAETARSDPIDLARSVEAAIYGLGKLLDRSLRGMFDGPTTVHVDWNGPGIVLDLSAVHHDPDALTLVMIATTAWLQAILADPHGPRRLQVLDEAWSLLGSDRTTKYLQTCWKSLAPTASRTSPSCTASPICAPKRTTARARRRSRWDCSPTPRPACCSASRPTRCEAAELLDLTATEATLLPRLAKGRALWKVGGHTAVVAHVIAPGELAFCDTDARMANR